MTTDIQQQAGKLLGHAAGYVATRTVQIGLEHGLIAALRESDGALTPEDLAGRAGVDAFYTEVWCRSAFAAGILDRTGDDGYELAPHVDTLLLDETSPAFAGALFSILDQPEIFDRFSENLPTGEGTWWDQVSPRFIATVGRTGTPFNLRLVPGGLSQVPGLQDELSSGARILELACGVGVGLQRMADHHPDARIVGVDGDAYSLERARQRLEQAGLADRVELVTSTLEDVTFEDEFDLVTINISMHEARDIEEVTANVHRALKAGGRFVISDFPFPEDDDGLRTVPGRLMCGIQFFEALIGDQLLPTARYEELLSGAGFTDVGSFQLAPVHVVVHGRK